MLLDSGQDAAQDYLNRPSLPEHLLFYWTAFWDLCSADGIAFRDLDAYASRYGIDEVEFFDRFKTLVRRLNAKWVEMIRTEDKEITEE